MKNLVMTLALVVSTMSASAQPRLMTVEVQCLPREVIQPQLDKDYKPVARVESQGVQSIVYYDTKDQDTMIVVDNSVQVCLLFRGRLAELAGRILGGL